MVRAAAGADYARPTFGKTFPIKINHPLLVCLTRMDVDNGCSALLEFLYLTASASTFEVFPTKTGRVTLRRMKDDEG
jgi:hypothetical protein